MNIRRSTLIAGAALVIAAPVASAQPGAPIVNPDLPSACIPPGLTKGQAKPEGWRPPAAFRPGAECAKQPLFVRPKDDARPAAPKPSPNQAAPSTPKPSSDRPGAKEPGGQGDVTEGGTAQADAPDVAPAFKASFFRRTWQVRANVFEVLPAGSGVRLDIDVERLVGVPKALRAEAKFIRDYGAYVLVGPKVKVQIFNPELDETFPATLQDIASDDEVRIRGRFLPRASWRTDEGGDRVPTMRATGVQIVDDTYTGDDDEDLVDPVDE